MNGRSGGKVTKRISLNDNKIYRSVRKAVEKARMEREETQSESFYTSLNEEIVRQINKDEIGDNMSGKNSQDPATKETVKRMRKNAEKLRNGESENIQTIGRTVADVADLIAALVDAGLMTKDSCDENRKEIEKEIERKSGNKGINTQTAIAIISTVAIVAGVVLTIVGELL